MHCNNTHGALENYLGSNENLLENFTALKLFFFSYFYNASMLDQHVLKLSSSADASDRAEEPR